MMCRRIDRIVNRNAKQRAEAAISPHHSVAAAMGEYGIETGNERTQWILLPVLHAIERCECVDIPKDRHLSRPAMRQHSALEFLIQYAGAAELHDHVGLGSAIQGAAHSTFVGRIDENFGPNRIVDIATHLPVETIRLCEQNRMAALGQCLEQSAEIGRSAVPNRGNEARSITGKSHNASDACPM